MEMEFDTSVDPITAYKNLNDNLFKQFEGSVKIKSGIEKFNNDIKEIYEAYSISLLKTAITALYFRDKVDENDTRTKKNYDELINKISMIYKQGTSSFSKLSTVIETANDVLNQIPKDIALLDTILTSDLSEEQLMKVIKRQLKDK